jgi:adenine-specific DNA-methyltransferase
MSRLNDLLRELRTREPALARDLEREVSALADRRAFGLNFERHLPEVVELPGRKVRKGDKVRVLPPRGKVTKRPDDRLWRVVGTDRSAGAAKLELLDPAASGETPHEELTAPLDDLVVVAQSRDPIYPGLVSTGKVERGGDKPFHTVINAENLHALETLLFTHRAKVDCIYIDPPYNTGAKDWKYNNDYVEGDDLYRHSKWLAFMERRLLLAKELLNPKDSVLLVTIDEKEYLRLGLLLEQTFPESTIQMVTSVINPKGTPKRDYFARVEEYVFFVYIGISVPSKSSTRMLGETEGDDGDSKPVRWASLQRSGGQSLREDTEVKFYPIFLDIHTGRITRIGDHVDRTFDISSVHPDRGEVVQWPIKDDGRHGCWQVSDDTLRSYLADGRVQVGTRNRKTGRWTLNFLMTSDWERIQDGTIQILGRDKHGALILSANGAKPQHGKTVWNMTSHSAADHGTATLKAMLPGREFPYPKSPYAVEDALRFAVARKHSAVILDFFAGSGTTAHAVMRLNKQDGGSRQAILVTNNEVRAVEQKAFRDKGLRPADPEWEALGICDYITKPRVKAAITGKTPDGEPIKGDYKFTDEFPMADGLKENAEFFTLTYEAPLRVASHREFPKIAPLLWMRAGSRGRRIDDISSGWDVADTYGVLADLDKASDFFDATARVEGVEVVYIVTDEDRLFQSLAQQLPDHIEPVRLYESYLRNFEIESGRGAR